MIHSLLEERWSPRSFQDKLIEPEKLFRVFEALRRAPSCSNEQPWRVLMGVKGEGNTWQQIFDHLDEGNKEWAINAPVLVVMLAVKTFHKNGSTNDWARYDTGQAAAHLSIQAMEEGIYVHQMGGFHGDTFRTDLNIPEHLDIVSFIALGYKGEVNNIPERHRAGEYNRKERKELEQVLFNDASQLK